MKTIIGLYLLFYLLTGYSKDYVSMELCYPDLYLKVFVKGVKLEKTPEYQFREGGLKVPIECAVYIRKGHKEVTLTLIESYKHLQYNIIDSFNLTPQASIEKYTFYNIKIMEKDFIQYNVNHPKTSINMVFEKENLEFALQLIDNLELTNNIEN